MSISYRPAGRPERLAPKTLGRSAAQKASSITTGWRRPGHIGLGRRQGDGPDGGGGRGARAGTLGDGPGGRPGTPRRRAGGAVVATGHPDAGQRVPSRRRPTTGHVSPAAGSLALGTTVSGGARRRLRLAGRPSPPSRRSRPPVGRPELQTPPRRQCPRAAVRRARRKLKSPRSSNNAAAWAHNSSVRPPRAGDATDGPNQLMPVTRMARPFRRGQIIPPTAGRGQAGAAAARGGSAARTQAQWRPAAPAHESEAPRATRR